MSGNHPLIAAENTDAEFYRRTKYTTWYEPTRHTSHSLWQNRLPCFRVVVVVACQYFFGASSTIWSSPIALLWRTGGSTKTPSARHKKTKAHTNRLTLGDPNACGSTDARVNLGGYEPAVGTNWLDGHRFMGEGYEGTDNDTTKNGVDMPQCLCHIDQDKYDGEAANGWYDLPGSVVSIRSGRSVIRRDVPTRPSFRLQVLCNRSPSTSKSQNSPWEESEPQCE